MCQLSVVIVNYKVPYFLLQCLDAVQRAAVGLDCEVLVVDNDSQDGSEELVARHFPSVTYIANPQNEGFAKANNKAIARAKGKYVLLLNPDTIIAEDTLQQVCHFADHAPDFGALGVRMIDPNGRFLPESKRGLPTIANALCKMLHFPYRGRNDYYYTQVQEHQVGVVPVLAGAFMLLNKQALGDATLLDERYFMYGEDIDLSYAVTLAGYKNYYFPTTILHYKGESTVYDAKYMRNFYGAMQLFYQKYHGKGLVNSLLKLQTRCMVCLGKWRGAKVAMPDERETVVLSTDECSYAAIIDFIEQNKGEKRVVVKHPNFQCCVEP